MKQADKARSLQRLVMLQGGAQVMLQETEEYEAETESACPNCGEKIVIVWESSLSLRRMKFRVRYPEQVDSWDAVSCRKCCDGFYTVNMERNKDFMRRMQHNDEAERRAWRRHAVGRKGDVRGSGKVRTEGRHGRSLQRLVILPSVAGRGVS